MPEVAVEFSLLLNHSKLPDAMIGLVRNIRVEHEINVPGMFSFTLDMASPTGKWHGGDLDTFAPGDSITVLLGANRMKSMIVGQITAIEPSFGEHSSATIRGFDSLCRLQFGKRTKVFENLDDNAIAEEVGRSAGLTVRSEGKRRVINSYVKQYQQSNYDFLLERCGWINYELVVDGTTLVFRPSAEGASPVRTLAFPKDVARVELNLRVPTSGSAVTVNGYNPETNEIITATAQGGTVRDLMGGEKNGYDLANRFPESAITLERADISDVQALQTIADARFHVDLEHFIEGSASMSGDPAIVAGVNLKITGLSQRFDGVYYVTSSVHTYDDDKGYATEVKLRRTGA